MDRKEDGINLIRVIALLLVFTFHYFLYNGYYSQPQVGIWMFGANFARALALSCNGIYMMLTGYLKSDKVINKHYYRCILYSLICYFLASAISIPIRHFYLNEVHSLSEWFEKFMGFGGVYYGWYIKMYIGLILISPIINLAISKIDNKKGLIFLMLLMVAATSVSPATPYPVFPSYWEIAYPLSYYMIGAVIKKIKPDIHIVPLISLILLSSIGTSTATLLSTDEGLSEAVKWEFGAIWIMVIAVCIFLLFYKVKLPDKISRLISFMAKGTFPAYLLSNLTDAWIYKLVPAWRSTDKYLLGFVCLLIPSYIVMIIIGNGFGVVAKKADLLIVNLYTNMKKLILK